jgi:uncharacterized membrane protein HdeD (DUF308 family)
MSANVNPPGGAAAGRPGARTDLVGALQEFSAAWWLLVLAGIAGVIAGIIVLAVPGISLAALAIVAGIFLLVDGAFEIGLALTRKVENRGLLALFGVLSVIAGVVLIRHPFGAVVAVALLVGIWLIALGIVRLFDIGNVAENRGWWLVIAMLEIVAGIVIVAVPDIGVATLAVLIGAFFIVRGAATAWAGWTLRKLRHAAPRPAARLQT